VLASYGKEEDGTMGTEFEIPPPTVAEKICGHVIPDANVLIDENRLDAVVSA